MAELGAHREVVVFPTELAMRRFQAERALADGGVDTTGHVSLSGLLRMLRESAVEPSATRSAVRNKLARREAVETARGYWGDGGVLGAMSSGACEKVLEQLERELAQLPLQAEKILDWMGARPDSERVHQLSVLYRVWQAQCEQEGGADLVRQHREVLRLLGSDRNSWPPLLREARRVVFRDVRWFSSFEEQVVLRLNERLKVRVESALPAAHSEAQQDTLGQRIRMEIQSDPWSSWVEEVGDALVMDSAEMLVGLEGEAFDFSRSVGTYGEVEDMARRMVWFMEEQDIAPHRLALVVPDMSRVQDIIPHVFGRFGLPYYFRRGRPVLSSPVVKAFMSFLAFPLEGSRDRLVDLVRHPALAFEEREQQVEALLEKYRFERLNGFELEWFCGSERLSGADVLERLSTWVVMPEDHFNGRAVEVLTGVLEALDGVVLPLGEMVDMLAQLLENETILPEQSREHGVAVISVEDAVGLSFDWIGFCGMNEGKFPEPVRQDAMFLPEEREGLRTALEEQGERLPLLALADVAVRMEQQRVRFLAALGMAKRAVHFSYSAVDEQGREQLCGRYFKQLWMLVGWASERGVVASAYDRWRMERLPANNFLVRHVARQQELDAVVRLPMLGESYLSVVPAELVRTADEALLLASDEDAGDEGDDISQFWQELAKRFEMEAERSDYLSCEESERKKSVYMGHVSALREPIQEWLAAQQAMSPTTLEALTHSRFLFLLNRVLGLEEVREFDDFPHPLDRGRLMHRIFYEVYRGVAAGDVPEVCSQAWAVRGERGWSLIDQQVEESIPLVRLRSADREAVLAYTERVARELIGRAVAAEQALGHPAVWSVEQEKLLESVRTAVAFDVGTCEEERRFPALFEFRFDESLGVEVGGLAIKGTVDRVDLLFDELGSLSALQVLDYKGSSRKQSKSELYAERVMAALDCQLPLYAFAAQQFFFGRFNEPELNDQTWAGYIITERDPKAFTGMRKKALLPLSWPEMVEQFVASLCDQLDRVRDGDFSVDPYHAGFENYAAVLRNNPLED
jgi:RecB family exonuclease